MPGWVAALIPDVHELLNPGTVGAGAYSARPVTSRYRFSVFYSVTKDKRLTKPLVGCVGKPPRGVKSLLGSCP